MMVEIAGPYEGADDLAWWAKPFYYLGRAFINLCRELGIDFSAIFGALGTTWGVIQLGLAVGGFAYWLYERSARQSFDLPPWVAIVVAAIVGSVTIEQIHSAALRVGSVGGEMWLWKWLPALLMFSGLWLTRFGVSEVMQRAGLGFAAVGAADWFRRLQGSGDI